jgi:hypothetical protein
MYVRNSSLGSKKRLSEQARNNWFGTEEKRDKHKERLSERNKKKWSDPVYRAKMIDLFSERMTKQHQDPKFSEAHSNRMSIRMSKMMKELHKDPEFAKRRQRRLHVSRAYSGYHNSPKAGNLYYRSSWELNAFIYLYNNHQVKRYKIEPFGIPYSDHNHDERTYYPDILVEYFDGYEELIEIKPFRHLGYPETQSKLLAGLLYSFRNHIGFRIWTEKNWPKEVSYAA